MSDIIKAAQAQDIGSELVYLYEIEYAPGEIAYFHPGVDSSLQEIQFRDYESPYTVRTYIALPIEMDGVEMQAEGALNRPTLTIANISNTLKTTIGGTSFESLLGKRVTKRTTLRKYLFGESADSSPPVEYPRDVFVIDRIQERNIISVTFELAAPYDIQGVDFPRRQIIGGLCPFRYQGAAKDIPEYQKRGGCRWDSLSRITIDGTEYTIHVNRDDEYIVPSSVSFTPYAGTSVANGFYSTTTSAQEITISGLVSDTVTDYWQARISSAGTPSDTNTNYRRVRVFSTYSSASTYKAYTNSDYNEYVKFDDLIWQVKQVTMTANQHQTSPKSGQFWTRGDTCGKRLSSCSARFQVDIASGQPSATDRKRQEPLPFGGFPASRQFG